MGVSYYDALLPVREPGAALPGTMAGLQLPYRVLGSIGVPAGRVVVALVSDSSRLSRMFAANWAPAGTGQEPDATLCALARPACSYGLGETWDRARWWSRERKMMVIFGSDCYRLVKVCVRGDLFRSGRRRHLVPARMRIACRCEGRSARRDHRGEFRGREDDARREPVAPS